MNCIGELYGEGLDCWMEWRRKKANKAVALSVSDCLTELTRARTKAIQKSTEGRRKIQVLRSSN